MCIHARRYITHLIMNVRDDLYVHDLSFAFYDKTLMHTRTWLEQQILNDLETTRGVGNTLLSDGLRIHELEYMNLVAMNNF